MQDGKSQKELFNFDDKPRKIFPGLTGLFPKADLEGKIAVTFTLEKMIFIIITIILFMVVIFAFGVEKGKAMMRPAISIALPAQERLAARPAGPAQKAPPTAPHQTAALHSTAIKIKTVPIAKVGPAALPAAADKTARPYTIIAATFLNKNTAIQEMNRLRGEGFDATVLQSDRYFKVCVGSYRDKDSAQGALKRVKQRYKDAYIKLR